jgi:hypothetical protein
MSNHRELGGTGRQAAALTRRLARRKDRREELCADVHS